MSIRNINNTCTFKHFEFYQVIVKLVPFLLMMLFIFFVVTTAKQLRAEAYAKDGIDVLYKIRSSPLDEFFQTQGHSLNNITPWATEFKVTSEGNLLFAHFKVYGRICDAFSTLLMETGFNFKTNGIQNNKTKRGCKNSGWVVVQLN